MSFWSWIESRFASPKPTHLIAAPAPKLLMTQACLDAVEAALQREMQSGHEGIVYLLGRTDRVVALATTVFKPEAITTPGSFHVEPRAMAACVAAAGQHELQVVGQLHTHPGGAFHSDGDVEGARIRYPGYASVVLPNYGRLLPSLEGAAAYIWTAEREWRLLGQHDVIIIPGAGPWTGSNGTTSGMTARSVTQRVV